MPNRKYVSLLPRLFSLLLLVICLAGLARPLCAQDAAHSPGWVVISVPDYRALRVKAFPAEREPEPPPVDATLSRVDYDLHVDTGVASGRATLTVDVLKNGWVRVPIPAGLFVREARLDGKPLSLSSSREANQLSALLSHPGRALIALDIALPVAASAGEERLSLPSTISGVTRVNLRFLIPTLRFRLRGGIVVGNSSGPGTGQLDCLWEKRRNDGVCVAPQDRRASRDLATAAARGADAVRRAWRRLHFIERECDF